MEQQRPRGSHSPSLHTLVGRAIRRYQLIEAGSTVLVACSGGPDSISLLHCLALWRKKLGFQLVGHGIDHGLRPEGSAELELARGFADGLGVPFSTSRVELAAGGNLQERAREVRHQRLREEAHRSGAERIATGHTADDRAETLMMRLLRGTGPKGLAVLTARNGELIRPLILARRREVLLHLERHRLPFASDPSNQNQRFLRAKVRAQLMPLLEELSPRFVESACALAESMAEIELDDPLDGLSRRQREQWKAIERSGKRAGEIKTRGGTSRLVEPHPREHRDSAALEQPGLDLSMPRKKEPVPQIKKR